MNNTPNLISVSVVPGNYVRISLEVIRSSPCALAENMNSRQRGVFVVNLN